MYQYPKIILKPGKEASLRRFHPWVFSGAVSRAEGTVGEGDIVEVLSSRNEFLALGHYAGSSIAVKVFSFIRKEVNDDFWIEKLKAAYVLREQLGLTDSPLTNAYRLVFSEGDSLPGLIIDFYNGLVVIQTHSTGMHRHKAVFVKALQEIYGDQLKAIYDKSGETMKIPVENQLLIGNSMKTQILETGHRFLVDCEKGQKTGFYLDQRSNRMFAQFYAKDRKVLNAFCYSGAFSVYALKGGAKNVLSVDSSRQAIEWAGENIALNGFSSSQHRTLIADVKQFLSDPDETFDMIILDPPAFAKTHSVTHNALQAYIHINRRAIQRLNPGGILFTFSCSQAISHDMFRSAVLSASLETGRELRILHHLTQGPDHPVTIHHPEGDYLKGLIMAAE